tara:strand:+ start:46 stop:525 length:480 start_codon:yes stop_codon:yes gene_type:complete
MKKLQILRIANYLIISLSIIGYISLWYNNKKEIKALESLGLFDSSFFQGSIIAGIIISIFLFLFVDTFCENAQNVNEHNNELLKQSIETLSYLQNKNSKKIIKNDNNKIIEVEGEKHSLEKKEILVKVKKSGKIQKLKQIDWEEIIELGNEDMFEIIKQ